MILVTGDIHGFRNLNKLKSNQYAHFYEMTKKDYVIICGDFGFVWDNGGEDIRGRDWLDQQNYTTLFVDGNHENFDLLNQYPITNWCDGKVHMITDSIIHLMRGQVFEIQGKSFFTMGGAESHDQKNRVIGESIWKEELPNDNEYTEALQNLKKHRYAIDYIITHCATSVIQDEVIKQTNSYFYPNNQLITFFDNIAKMVTFRKWFCGHYHIDLISHTNPKIHVLFDNIEEVQ